jgi:RNA polymerase sigma-70 factor (ECF subfamily)
MKSPHPTFFATTRWTVVREAAQGGDTEASAALGVLFQTYWQPLYRYVRRRGKSPADAEDLVQGFFAKLLENQGLRLVDQDRGRFRAFLLAGLKNFMAGDWQYEHRQKRGGDAVILSLDWRAAETGLGLELPDTRSPDRLFDRDWAMALLDNVLEELAETESDFSRWKPWLSARGATLPYARIAEEMGMTEGAARVAVHRLRKRYREALRRALARTLDSEELVNDEMQALFAALSE